jgi:hypothetical protein
VEAEPRDPAEFGSALAGSGQARPAETLTESYEGSRVVTSFDGQVLSVQPSRQPDSTSIDRLSQWAPHSRTDAQLYGQLQLQRWSAYPAQRIHPHDPVYPSRTEGWDMREYLGRVVETSGYIQTMGIFPRPGWSRVFRLRFARLPIASTQLALGVPLDVLSPPQLVAVLQTGLYEQGYEFENVAHTGTRSPRRLGRTS